MWFWWNFLNSLNLVLSKWQLLVQAGDKDFMRIMTYTSFSAGFILYKILFITFGIYYCKLYRILLNSFGTCRWKTLLVILDVDSQLELLTDCLMCMTYPLVNIMVFSFKIFARQKQGLRPLVGCQIYMICQFHAVRFPVLCQQKCYMMISWHEKAFH